MSIIMKRASLCPGFTDIGDIPLTDISYWELVESVPNDVRIVTAAAARSDVNYTIHELGTRNISMGYEYAMYIHLITVPTLKFMIFGRAIEQIAHICNKLCEFHGALYAGNTGVVYTLIGLWYNYNTEDHPPVRMLERNMREKLSAYAVKCCWELLNPTDIGRHIDAHWHQVTEFCHGTSQGWKGHNLIPAKDTSFRSVLSSIMDVYESGNAQIMLWADSWETLIRVDKLSEVVNQDYRIIGVGSKCKGDAADNIIRYYLTNTPKDLEAALEFDKQRNSEDNNVMRLWGFWWFHPDKNTIITCKEFASHIM